MVLELCSAARRARSGLGGFPGEDEKRGDIFQGWARWREVTALKKWGGIFSLSLFFVTPGTSALGYEEGLASNAGREIGRAARSGWVSL